MEVVHIPRKNEKAHGYFGN